MWTLCACSRFVLSLISKLSLFALPSPYCVFPATPFVAMFGAFSIYEYVKRNLRILQCRLNPEINLEKCEHQCQATLLHKPFAGAGGFTFSGAGAKPSPNCRF
jgi:hypothetical protein